MDVLTYRSLRDEVYGKLKQYVREEELVQKDIKNTRATAFWYFDGNQFGVAMSSFYAKEAAKQSKKLTKLYEIIRFLKYGLREDTTRAEEYFNEIFAKHKNFRNDFWTFWNAKFNKEQEK